jgi:iron complex outermembrane receptor protein
MDTPFSTTVYTEKYIQNNRRARWTDAVVDDPTIRSVYVAGSVRRPPLHPGLRARPGDMMFNGLYGSRRRTRST